MASRNSTRGSFGVRRSTNGLIRLAAISLSPQAEPRNNEWQELGVAGGSTLPFSVRHVRSFVVLEATRMTLLSSSRSRPLRLISARGSPLRFEPSFKILDADLVLNLEVADGDRN